MKFFLHDLSKLAVSTLGLTLNAVNCAHKTIKDKFTSLLQNSGFVNRNEFVVFTDIAKDLKTRQDQLEKKLKIHTKTKNG